MARSVISVWIVDKDDFEREEISGLINETVDIRCKRTFESCEEMFAYINRSLTLFWPDVVIVNYQLRKTFGPRRLAGIQGIRQLKKINPDVNCLVRTRSKSSSLIAEALFAGANGFVKQPASIDSLISTIRTSFAGGTWMVPAVARRVEARFNEVDETDQPLKLTQQEANLLDCMHKGKSRLEAMQEFGLSRNAMGFILEKIYIKLHVRTDALKVARPA